MGFEFVRSSGGIKEYKLKLNDLSVLLMEKHHAPVVTFMVTYRVGSRNEAAGHTGATHLLEHLMFKGSKNFNKENRKWIWELFEKAGARNNASTWLDRTNYFETVQSSKLEDMIAIEADRMHGAFIREQDRVSEMTVVRNEFELAENSPLEALDKQIWATAYQAHPYHHSTIGWRSDIENMPIERLRQFYDDFYWPNNATLSVIGDFDSGQTLKLIAKYFGAISKSSKPIPVMYTTEPMQQGPRRLTVRRVGTSSIVGIAHKMPRGSHAHTYPFQVLGKILGYGKASRFQKRLIDAGLATEITVWDHPFHDDALFFTYAFLTPKTDHKLVENIILQEYEAIKRKGVLPSEVERVKAMLKADFAFDRDGSYRIAALLNEAIALGDWTFYTTYEENINRVSVEDVRRVAQKYLVEDQSTTGYFISLNPPRIRNLSG